MADQVRQRGTGLAPAKTVDASRRDPCRHRPDRSGPADAVCAGAGVGDRGALDSAACACSDDRGMACGRGGNALLRSSRRAGLCRPSAGALVRVGAPARTSHAMRWCARAMPHSKSRAAVRQFQADRVLLGTRSRSKLGKLLLGSVAEQVLRSVNLPVITVGPEAHLPVAGDGQERVVLHATTLRETSRPSAALACHIAASQGARLVLLHVLPPSTRW